MTMKKISLFLAVMAVSLVGFSQAKVAIGLKGGLNIANIDRNDIGATYNSTTGYHFGAYGLIKVLNIGIQPEVLYSVRGTEVSISGLSQDLSQDFVYLDIPILLKFYLPLGINLQAGPQFGLLMSVDGEVSDGSGGTTTISKDSYKDADMSAAFGLGWDAPFGLNLSARYVLGLSDVNNLAGVGETKNRTFQLAIGYKLFGVGR